MQVRRFGNRRACCDAYTHVAPGRVGSAQNCQILYVSVRDGEYMREQIVARRRKWRERWLALDRAERRGSSSSMIEWG